MFFGGGIVVTDISGIRGAQRIISYSFAAEDEQEAAASGGGDKDVAEAVQEKLAQLSVAKDGAAEGEEEEDGEEEEGEEEEEEEEIDYPPAVTALILLQQQHEELGDGFKKEFAALLKKYAALKKPLYESRATIVKDGISAAAAAAVVDGPKQAWASGEGEGEGAAAAAAARPAAGAATAEGGEVDKLPNFWLMCFQNHEMTCEMMLGERDEKALSYLIDVRAAYNEDMTGFKLEFEFSEDNEFFSNKVLTKSYEIPNLSDPFASTPTLQAVEGTEIEWESGMDLTVKLVTKKVKKKSSGGRRGGGGSTTRTVTREEPCKSFFNFFTAPDLEALEAGPDDDEDEPRRRSLHFATGLSAEASCCVRGQRRSSRRPGPTAARPPSRGRSSAQFDGSTKALSNAGDWVITSIKFSPVSHCNLTLRPSTFILWFFPPVPCCRDLFATSVFHRLPDIWLDP